MAFNLEKKVEELQWKLAAEVKMKAKVDAEKQAADEALDQMRQGLYSFGNLGQMMMIDFLQNWKLAAS